MKAKLILVVSAAALILGACGGPEAVKEDNSKLPDEPVRVMVPATTGGTGK